MLPYDRSSTSVPPGVRQVLDCYRNEHGQSVERATLVEVDGRLLSDFDEQARARVFRSSGLFAFSALAHRQLFSSRYFNTGSFATFIEPIGDAVANRFRRRDGSVHRVAPRALYRVDLPSHVPSPIMISSDPALVSAFEATKQVQEHRDAIDEVLLQLHMAESDEPGITDAMQLMLFSGCLQRLTGTHVGTGKADETAKSLRELIASEPRWQPAAAGVSSRQLVVERHLRRTLFEAWFRDFYQTRNDYAHGDLSPQRPSAWTVEEHLLMASFVVPRLAVLQLQAWNYYTTNERDRQRIRAIDRLLKLDDLFAHDDAFGVDRWHWTDALSVLCTSTDTNGAEVDTMLPRTGPIDHSQVEVSVGSGSGVP